MEQKKHFYTTWVVFNPIGFTLGSWLGATDNGLVSLFIPGTLGLIFGDLIFGATIGLSQFMAFQRSKYLPVSIAWIVASSIGFTLGARIGSLFTFRITDHWVLAGIIFGVFMGGAVGIATGIVFFKRVANTRVIVWIIFSIIAWVAGESIAFAFLFSHTAVPLVALAIAAITGLGLIYLRSYSDKDKFAVRAYEPFEK